jgi:hypothetical protein
MALPSEITVLKGSASGKVTKDTLKGKGSLEPNEVALRITNSGVSSNKI